MPGRYRSFDGVAKDYDKTRVIPDAQLRSIAKTCASTAKVEKSGLFLDAGVGTGRFAVPLSQIAPGRTIGVDISLEMMRMIQPKDPEGRLSLLSGDLRSLPLRDCSIRGALAVHILHIIEDWKTVLDELSRVIEPGGVLILGTELGGRSLLTDFYFERARARRVLVENIGATSSSPALNYLRQKSSNGSPSISIELLSTPSLTWKRLMPVTETLSVLERATFTQMWDIPPDHHKEILQETRNYADRMFPTSKQDESLKAQFVMHAVRWPKNK